MARRKHKTQTHTQTPKRFTPNPLPRLVTHPDPDTTPAIKTLLEMLTYRRPHLAQSWFDFIDRFLLSIGENVWQDKFGNVILQVGDDPNILWSAHTDTVHRWGGRQTVNCTNGFVYTLDLESNCLGADNGAGCWLLREMALAGVPGLYIWHADEESGAHGSSSLVKHCAKDFLQGIQVAIAFDRRGTTSIITEQGMDYCCSDTCAESIATLLGMEHKPDPTGMFTDTVSYVDDIAECTNISSGTCHEHNSDEMLDLNYLWHLREAVLKADWSKVAIEREPGDRGFTRYYGSYHGFNDDLLTKPMVFDLDDPKSLDELCEVYPEVASQMLQTFGISAEEFAEAAQEFGYDVGWNPAGDGDDDDTIHGV